MMLSINDWNEMNWLDRTLWLENNAKRNSMSYSIRALSSIVGLNDADYMVKPTIDGVQVSCPAYASWREMIVRCHNDKRSSRNPTYKGVSVCDDWMKFSEFRKWWIEKHVDGWEIDKDILGSGKEYSPSCCVFVPSWLNKFITNRAAKRGCFPIGVSFHKATGKFQASCRNPSTGRQEHLGLFTTPEDAHISWRTRKMEIALELKMRMDEIDLRIYPRVVEVINNVK